VIKITYRSEPEDISKPIHFDLAMLGYNSDLSREGLRQFAENNKEQVEKLKWNTYDCELYLKDGTRIKAINYGERFLHGYKFDQLILFDDDRWQINDKRWHEIREIMESTMYTSYVPEDYQIIYYEDIA
jgi:hypothetical protein